MSLLGALFVGDPDEVVSAGGRPAAVVPHRGMPSYETDEGLVVMESVIVWSHGVDAGRWPLVLPLSYRNASIRGRGDVPVHDEPSAVWRWRPVLYDFRLSFVQRMGSQRELAYRSALWEAVQMTATLEEQVGELMSLILDRIEARCGFVPNFEDMDDDLRAELVEELRAFRETKRAEWPDMAFEDAERRAGAVLRENLSPQQRVELDARGGFHVRGELNHLYRVKLGEGFSIVHRETHDEVVGFCLHPEEWMPDADVALATKLLMDAGIDGETELLDAARPAPLLRHHRTKPTAREEVATRLERRWSLYP